MDKSKNRRQSSVLQRAFSLEKSLKIPKSQQDDGNISTASPVSNEEIPEKKSGFRSLRDKLGKNLEIQSPINDEDIQEKKSGFRSLRDVVVKKLEMQSPNDEDIQEKRFSFKSLRDVVEKKLERQRGAESLTEDSEEELSIHSFDNDEV